MTQLAQRLGLDLTNSFAGDLEALADFFERMFGAVFEAEAHLDDALLARSQSAQNLRSVLLQVDADHGVGRRYGLAVFDEVAQVRILFLSDRRFERDRLLRDL